MQIDYLAAYPGLIPELTELLFAEWQDLYLAAGLSQADLAAALQERAVRDRIPLTLVAIDDGQLVGAGSIKLSEDGTRVGLTPWLAGIYVKEDQRGKGLGIQIVTALEQIARELGVPRLYLSADNAEHFYLKLGWQVLDKVESFGVRDVALMSKDLTAAVPR
jgi:GNAT superfamily N-acetyltransferase